MSYRTSALGRRLSYKTIWGSPVFFKNSKDFLIDFRLKAFIRSVFNTTVKPAAKNKHTKTKSVLGYRPKAHPVIMGEIQILRKVSSIFFVINYFLMEEGVHSRRFSRLEWKILKGTIFLEKLLNKKIHLLFNNYYHYVLNAKVFVHPKKYIRILAQKLILKNFSKTFGDQFRSLYANLGYFMQIFEKKFSRYRRNNYFERIFFPLISLFFMKKFDVTLLAKVIALELQTLRKFHVPFLDFVNKLLKAFFKSLNKNKILGIQIFVKGRMTFYRRQVRRKQKKIYNIGVIKRSCINTNVTSHNEISYNRYGIMNVLVTVHEKKMEKILVSNDSSNSINTEMAFFWNFFNEEDIKNDLNFDFLLKTKQDLDLKFNNISLLDPSQKIKKDTSFLYQLKSFYKKNSFKHFYLFRQRTDRTFQKYRDISTKISYNYTGFYNNISLYATDEKSPTSLAELDILTPFEKKKKFISNYSLPLSDSLLFKKQKKNFTKWLTLNKKGFSKKMTSLLNSWKFKDYQKRVKLANLIKDKFVEIIYRPYHHFIPLFSLAEKQKILSFLIGLKKVFFINNFFILRNSYSAKKVKSLIYTYPKNFIFINFLQSRFRNFFVFVFFLFKLFVSNFSVKENDIFNDLINKSQCFNESHLLFIKNSKLRFKDFNTKQPGYEFLVKKEYKSLFYFFTLKQYFSSFATQTDLSKIKNYKFYPLLCSKSLFVTKTKSLNKRICNNIFWKSILKKYLNKRDLTFKKDPSIFLFRTTLSLTKRKLKRLFLYKLLRIRKKKQRHLKKKRKNELRAKK